MPIIELKSYKIGACNAIQKEQEHAFENPSLEAINYNPALSDKNVIIHHDERLTGKYTDFIDRVLTDEKEQGHKVSEQHFTDKQNSAPVLISIVVSMTTQMYQSLTEAERDQYFRDSYEHITQTLFKGAVVADARIHKDEGYWKKAEDDKKQFIRGQDHLQLTILPTYRTIDQEKGIEKVRVGIKGFEKDCVERNFYHTKAERENETYTDKDGNTKNRVYNKADRRNFGHDMQREFIRFHREKGRDVAERSFNYTGRAHEDPTIYKEKQAVREEKERLAEKAEELRQKGNKQFDIELKQNERIRVIQAKEKQQQAKEKALTEKEQEIKEKSGKLARANDIINKKLDNYNKVQDYFADRNAFIKEIGTNDYTYERMKNLYDEGTHRLPEIQGVNGTYFLEPELNSPYRTQEQREELQQTFKKWLEPTHEEPTRGYDRERER